MIRILRGLGLIAVTTLAASTLALATEPTTEKVTLRIPAQQVGDALNDFAKQSGLQVVLYTDVAEGLRAPALEGIYTSREALERLLGGTALKYEFINARTIAVRAPDNGANADTGAATVQSEPRTLVGGEGAGGIRLAQDQSEQQSDSTSVLSPEAKKNPESPPRDSKNEDLEEVVVTGTRIRGGRTASPLAVFDREDIGRSGLGSTSDFIRSLPQNFGGGVSDNGVDGNLGGDSTVLNLEQAAGANLRGLGNDATLILLNGRRLAPSSFGGAVDLSAIPLAAVERLEVLTDGASAIYGSDAVGGVVNLILRDDFSGAETRLRYGTDEDDLSEVQFGHVMGANWNSGRALLAYEYRDRSSLDSSSRSLAETAPDPTDLMPESEQHSLILSANQQVSPRADLFFDGLYSTRDSFTRNAFGGLFSSEISADQFSATVGSRIDLSDAWQAEVSILYGNHNMNRAVDESGSPTGATYDTESDVWSLEGRLDGPVLSLPAGEARAALGFQHRQETFESRGTVFGSPNASDRDVSAVFGEVLVPIFGPDNRTMGFERLEVTIAGRYEEYSDFGSTTNPKVGLLWSPLSGLNLRGTWGTSFRSPQLFELDDQAIPISGFTFAFPDPLAAAADTPTLVISGNNSSLVPEEAEVWTAGFDLRPPSLPQLNISATYFSIDFQDRIGEPIPFAALLSVLFNESDFAPVITRNPNPADVAFYLSFPGVFDFLELPPDQIDVLIDNRLRNIGRLRQDGIDFNLGYDFETAIGDFNLQVAGTYLLDRAFQVSPSAPFVDSLNTVFNPVDLRVRSGVSWSLGEWGANAFVNYVTSYDDDRTAPATEVDSWITADANLTFDTGGTVFFVGVENLFDEVPPFVSQFIGINFDPANANPAGRFISFGVTHRW